VIGVLQQAPLPALDLEQVTQVAGVEQQLLVCLPLPARAEGRCVEPGGDPLHDREQLQRAERLEHERFRADLGRRRLVGHVRTGEEHDRDVAGRARGLQLRAERCPVQAGHADVEHDRVRTGDLDALPGRHCIRGLVDLDVHGFERRAEKCTKSVVVINEQEAQGGRPPS